MKCTRAVLEKAQLLNDLFPTSGLREKINFVNECPMSLTIDDIVAKYLDNLSKRKSSNYAKLPRTSDIQNTKEQMQLQNYVN
jgi:hypothetical protein